MMFLLYIIYFDTTFTFFWVHIFHFFVCEKDNVVISKVHYEFIIFLKFIQFFLMMIPIKVYDNINNIFFDNVNFEYGFKFYICM
jgi:hypothetical protein